MSGLATRYVPPAFALAELDAPWIEDRWFVHFDGALGKPPQAVTLGAASSKVPDRALARSSWVDIDLWGDDAVADLNVVNALMLLLLGAPGIAHREDTKWSPCTWILDGQEVEAQIHHRGDRWCGYCADPAAPQRQVAVGAANLNPESIVLRPITVDAYHFNPGDEASLDIAWTYSAPKYLDPRDALKAS